VEQDVHESQSGRAGLWGLWDLWGLEDPKQEVALGVLEHPAVVHALLARRNPLHLELPNLEDRLREASAQGSCLQEQGVHDALVRLRVDVQGHRNGLRVHSRREALEPHNDHESHDLKVALTQAVQAGVILVAVNRASWVKRAKACLLVDPGACSCHLVEAELWM
jgi:hypothetical protein